MIIAANDLRICGQFNDLILMPCVQINRAAVIAVRLVPNGPTIIIFFDLTAHRLCNHLMAKTNPNHWPAFGVSCADEFFQRRNKRDVFVGPVFGPGDQPSICVGDRPGKIPINHVPNLEGKSMPIQQAGKHINKIAMIFQDAMTALNPFFNIRNNFSIRTGNPDLQPEFTDSYEVNGIYIFNKFSLNLGVYHRFTTDVIERVSLFKDNVNTTTPLNIGTNKATGIEFNGKYSPGKWLSINGDFNMNFFDREGNFESAVFDFVASQWSSKLTSQFKLPWNLDVEVTGNYRSSYQTVQSIVSANLFADFGFRKKVLGGKGVVNLSIRDVFTSRFREYEIDQNDFYLYSFSQRGRFISLGFSYGFGKGEAMEYLGGKRR